MSLLTELELFLVSICYNDAAPMALRFHHRFGWTKFLVGGKVAAMKPGVSNQKSAALTLVEVMVIIVVLFVLAALLLPSTTGVPVKATSINCRNNLKQVGMAYRIWAGDHDGKYPMQVSVADTHGGGTMELANGGNAWINYAVMSNELSTAKILWCPTDTDKTCATNFTTDFNGRKISYFVGLNADTNHPQAFLSGDDNFEISGVSVKSGLLEIFSNTPVAWTTARHNRRGNIGFADGSVQMVSSKALAWQLNQTDLVTNRLAIP